MTKKEGPIKLPRLKQGAKIDVICTLRMPTKCMYSSCKQVPHSLSVETFRPLNGTLDQDVRVVAFCREHDPEIQALRSRLANLEMEVAETRKTLEEVLTSLDTHESFLRLHTSC